MKVVIWERRAGVRRSREPPEGIKDGAGVGVGVGVGTNARGGDVGEVIVEGFWRDVIDVVEFFLFDSSKES